MNNTLILSSHLAGLSDAVMYVSINTSVRPNENIMDVRLNLELTHRSRYLLDFYQSSLGNIGIVAQSSPTRHKWSITSPEDISKFIDVLIDSIVIKKNQLLIFQKVINMLNIEGTYTVDQMIELSIYADTILALNPRTKKDLHFNMKNLKESLKSNWVHLTSEQSSKLVNLVHLKEYIEIPDYTATNEKYLAGFFDGHGGISAKLNAESSEYPFSLEMVMYSLPNATYLAYLHNKFKKCGYLEQYQDKEEKWVIRRLTDIGLILRKISPYTISSKEEISIVLQIISLFTNYNLNKQTIKDLILKLNMLNKGFKRSNQKLFVSLGTRCY
jgi:hypothetical protein